MDFFDQLDLFSVYVFSITINVLISISLSIFYFYQKKENGAILKFALGFWLLTLGMLLATFRKYFPDFLVAGLTGPLFVSGLGSVLSGFLSLYRLRSRQYNTTFLALCLLLLTYFVGFDTSLSFRLILINTAISLIFLFAVKIYAQKWNYRLLRALIIFSAVVISTLTYRSYTISEVGLQSFFDLTDVEKALMFSSMLYTNLLSIFVILGIGFALINESEMLSRKNELLVKEMNHRISNSLNSLIGMIQMDENPDRPEILRQLTGRLHSISKVHQFLYSTQSLEYINLSDYIPPILYKVAHSFNKESLAIQTNIEPIRLDPDSALHLALVTNELVINSCKYAFGDSEGGQIKLEIRHVEKGMVQYDYSDDGPGKNYKDAKSGFGSRIIEHAVKSLEGEITEPPGEYYYCQITFPAFAKTSHELEPHP